MCILKTVGSSIYYASRKQTARYFAVLSHGFNGLDASNLFVDVLPRPKLVNQPLADE
jgi:hypothetical protein